MGIEKLEATMNPRLICYFFLHVGRKKARVTLPSLS